MRRNKEQWQTLIQEQAASGLSAVEFCKQHQLCDKYFSLRKRQLSAAAFVPVVSQTVARASSTAGELSLNYGRCTLQFARAPSAPWLAALMQSLS
jgi:hypothetical protein